MANFVSRDHLNLLLLYKASNLVELVNRTQNWTDIKRKSMVFDSLVFSVSLIIPNLAIK